VRLTAGDLAGCSPQRRHKELTITPLAAYPLHDVTRIAYHDRVRVPDGRAGEVIGFYRRKDESALVLFSCGESDQFLIPDIEPLSLAISAYACACDRAGGTCPVPIPGEVIAEGGRREQLRATGKR